MASVVNGAILLVMIGLASTSCMLVAKGALSIGRAATLSGLFLLLSTLAGVAGALLAPSAHKSLHWLCKADAEALACSAFAWLAGTLVGACVAGSTAAWRRYRTSDRRGG